MLRRSVQPVTSIQPAGRSAAGERSGARRAAAPRLAQVAWILLAPWAALAAALAGLVFVVLLPICGIASLAEGFGSVCWRAARDAAFPRDRGIVSHD